MKRFLHLLLAIVFAFTLVSANLTAAFASSGDDEHTMEMEVNGYHITLASQNEWKKGENAIVVTLMDSMGMPVQNAEVEILLAPRSDGHSATESAHSAELQNNSMPGMEIESSHDSMPGMDMGEAAEVMLAHDEELAEPIAMIEAEEQGMYRVKTHFESSGEHDVNVMFHVNGEMLQARFVVDILRSFSKSLVLWSFVAVNVALMVSAGVMKKQAGSVKGRV